MLLVCPSKGDATLSLLVCNICLYNIFVLLQTSMANHGQRVWPLDAFAALVAISQSICKELSDEVYGNIILF